MDTPSFNTLKQEANEYITYRWTRITLHFVELSMHVKVTVLNINLWRQFDTKALVSCDYLLFFTFMRHISGWNLARYELQRCMRNPFWKVCRMCVCAALFRACNVRSHFAHFCTLFGTKLPENATFLNILSCFGTSFPVLYHLILF